MLTRLWLIANRSQFHSRAATNLVIRVFEVVATFLWTRFDARSRISVKWASRKLMHLGRNYSLRTNLRVLLVGSMLAIPFPLASLANASRNLTSQQIPAPPFAVGVARCTFVDRTRGVLSYSTTPPTKLSNVRKLVTEIRYPTQFVAGGPNQIDGAQPAPRSGGYPMIVFAHGYDVTPDTYATLLDAWVRAGFVVAAPFFPDENKFAVAAQHGVNTENDVRNEPADLTFVTRSILQASASGSQACHVVSGLVQASELGLVGHSDGATAVGLLSFARGNDPQGVSYASLRVGLDYRAAVIMSGEEDGAQRYSSVTSSPALLVIQSAADQCSLISNAVKLYGDIDQSNKWFLELLTAHHLPPFDGVDGPAFGVVAKTSTRFFRITLQGATPAISLVTYGNENPSVAEMFQGGRGPTLNKTPSVPLRCGPN